VLENYHLMLKDGASHFGAELNQTQLEQFSAYAGLLVEWNEKINLTSITDEEGITVKHFIDSLSVAGYIRGGESLIDVGTGAGFPGIPLKIARENLKVTLLDSLDKRVKYLNEVVAQLKLKNIQAVHGRAEDFGVNPVYREKFDIAIARAVSELAVLCEYCLPFVKVGGSFIAMKGPDIEQELQDAQKAISVLGGEFIKTDRFTLPNSSMDRTLVIIKKCRHTPPGYPRKSGKPTKSPIR
jgi:16S rRNA (guanine527-N7)-methyltransferase